MWWHFQLTFKLPSADISLKRLYKILYLKMSLKLTRLLTLLMLLTLSRARSVQKRVWRVISTLLRCACRLLLRHLDEWKWLRSLRLFGLHSFCHHYYLLRKNENKSGVIASPRPSLPNFHENRQERKGNIALHFRSPPSSKGPSVSMYACCPRRKLHVTIRFHLVPLWFKDCRPHTLR